MSNSIKLTKKDYFEKVIALLNGALDFGFNPEDDVDAVIAFCEKEIDALDRRSARAHEKAEQKRAEPDALYDAIADTLTADFQAIDDILNLVSDQPEVTRGKVSNRLAKLAKDGRAEKGDIMVAGADGKSKKAVGYRAIA